jgi:hypothetical protein
MICSPELKGFINPLVPSTIGLGARIYIVGGLIRNLIGGDSEDSGGGSYTILKLRVGPNQSYKTGL